LEELPARGVHITPRQSLLRARKKPARMIRSAFPARRAEVGAHGRGAGGRARRAPSFDAMIAARHRLLLLIFALAAGPAWSAQYGNRLCDRRLLPQADTVSVLAAARTSTHGKLTDLRVVDACITGVTTRAWLSTPKRKAPSGTREQWTLGCVRQQSTWAKRGGWLCDNPILTRELDARVTFRGKERTALISLDARAPIDTAASLVERALTFFDTAPPVPLRCGGNGSPEEAADWKKRHDAFALALDESRFDASIESGPDGSLSVRPVLYLGVEFPAAAATDPARAGICWFEEVIVT
jgi:hypothetical protein